MQKRLLRLSTQNQIRQHVTGFVGKKINIVLNDNTVVLAELLKFSESELLVQNMRRQELSVAFTDIYEIIIDINA
jgi:chaperone required for assembly of F1-ATPase